VADDQASKVEEPVEQPVENAEQILDEVLNDENAVVENESNGESLK